MAKQIGNSVGLSGQNARADVGNVQELLNRVSVGQGGPPSPIAVDGLVGPETVGAVTRFQKKNFGWSDGRVDPNGHTLARLNAYADMAGRAVGVRPLAFFPPPNRPDRAGLIDGAGLPGSGNSLRAQGPADLSVMVTLSTGSVFASTPTWTGPAFTGLVAKAQGMIWTLDDGFAMLQFIPSQRTVHVGSSSVYFIGQPGPVPASSVQYYKNNPSAAPYYQAGSPNAPVKPVPWNVAEGPVTPPAPYYQNKGVSPGYFNQ
jgi:peptidoglycan hydrolase-like protein with peptidoglycan-binding domain